MVRHYIECFYNPYSFNLHFVSFRDIFKDYKWHQDNTRKEGDDWMAIVAKTIHWQLPKICCLVVVNKLGFLSWLLLQTALKN